MYKDPNELGVYTSYINDIPREELVMNEVNRSITRVLRLDDLTWKDRAILRAAYNSLKKDRDGIINLRDEFVRIGNNLNDRWE
jgi:hypothetical protein